MWTLDTETKNGDDGEQSLLLISIYGGSPETCLTFFTAEDFRDWAVQNLTGDLWIHNTAFDVPMLFFNEVFSGCDFFDFLSIRSAILFKWKTNAGTVSVRDSLLLFPMSLRKLAALAGQTEKGDFDIRAWQDAGCPVTAELIEYNRLDCISLYEALEVMFRELHALGVDDIKNTMAATAYKFVEQSESDGEIIRSLSGHLPAVVDKMVRKAYFGGRCEPFFIGELDNVRHVDKRSMYPSCLVSELYPVMFDNPNRWRAVSGKKFPRARWPSDAWIGVFDVVVKVPEDHPLPPIPKRTPKGLRFPVGVFETSLLLQEIQFYPECEILSYSGYVAPVEMRGYYSGIFSRIYNERAECRHDNPVKAQLLKLLMNSANGKHAQRRDFPKIVKSAEPISGGTVRCAALGLWEVPAEDTKRTIFTRNAYITALTTAYARKKLYDFGREIQKQGGTLLYCDTDSWFYAGLPRYEHSGEKIEDWAVEPDDGERHVFAGRKMWASESEVRCKGVSKRAGVTYGDIKNIAEGRPVSFTELRFEKFRSMSNRHGSGIRVYDLVKTLTRDEELINTEGNIRAQWYER